MQKMALVGVAAVALVAASTVFAEDPYIQSYGTSGISTGYRMKGGISRVEVDFALTTAENSAQTWVFGTDNHESTLRTMLYFTGSGVGSAFMFRVRGGENVNAGAADPDLLTKTGDRAWDHAADTDRHVLIVDLKNGLDQVRTGGALSMSQSFDADLLTGLTADLPLSLFGRYANGCATAFEKFCKAKIYGVKIYENDVLVYDFVPCLKDGETPCFRDLVGGGFIIGENIAAFRAGGDNVPTYQDDAYVSTVSETPGEYLYVDTGYLVKNTTRVELDCALASNMVGTVGWILFDANNGTRYQFGYMNPSLRFLASGATTTFDSSAFPKPTAAKDVRRTFVLDLPGLAASVVTSGFTNKTVAITGTTSYGSGGSSMKLACAYATTWGAGSPSSQSPLKIYGLKIYEDGALKHDFAPYVKYDYATHVAMAGLLDRETGNFASGYAKSDAMAGTVASLPYGGAIEGEQDAYIESDGTTGMSAGYCMAGAVSRVEVDFSFVTPAAQKYIYGSGVDATLQTFLYTTGSGVGDSFKFCQRPYTGNACDTQWAMAPDTKRHTAVTDLKNKKNILTGLSPESKTFVSDFSGKAATLPLTVFGKYSSSEATAINGCPNARIYSVRFYENYVEGGDNTPVRELIPYSRDGVVGFYDTVTGEIVRNDSAAVGAFTFGGAGTDHGSLNCYIKPGYAGHIDYGETTHLTAYAPGATSYRWLRDGQPVTGGSDGVLTVGWARGGAKTADEHVHTYQAIAVFDDFYGVIRESVPAAVTVTNRFVGACITIK